jgi:predicted lipoprotein with Yx(FWY)xxD motif
MKRITLLTVLACVAAVFALSASAFGRTAHAGAAAAVVTTKQTSLGLILVTATGHTLYMDSADKPGKIACTGGCLGVWPALQTSGKPKAAGKAKASLLSTVKNGKVTQVTYNHHPLYTFATDTKSAPTSGQAQNGFFVVSPSGAKIAKTASAKTTTATSTGPAGW